MNSPSPSKWPEYRAAVDRFITSIDSVLEQGRLAQRRHDHLARARELRGADPTPLLARFEDLSPVHRHIHRRVVQLTENMYRTHLGPLTEPRAQPSRPATRALASPHRI